MFSLALLACSVSGAVSAQEKGATTTNTSFATASVSRSAAVALIDAALIAAKRLGLEVAVAVTDGTGTLRAFERLDGAPFLTAEVAINKAWTSASYGHPTHVWNAYVAAPKVAPIVNIPHMMAVGGGYPLVESGKLIGGIGVSGGSAEQDQEIAESALKALGLEIKK